MIRNQWYAVLESREVNNKHPIGVTRMGEKLVFWRNDQGKLACLVDKCPHRGVALSTGTIKGNNIQCPFHGFEFDVSGKCVLIPANSSVASVPKVFAANTYPVREVHGFIWIFWGVGKGELPPIKFFSSLDDSFTYSTLKDHWHTHYSRAIENQLDVLHLPFVHHNTIGRGNRTVVDGPIYRWECDFDPEDCDLLNIWVYNRVDDEIPAKRVSELPKPQRRPFLQFRYPNVWHNWISDDIRVFVAFAPIDSENTLMYLRYYQRVINVPVLKQIMNGLGKIANLVIERQDKHVVETQRPYRSDIRIGEKLVPGDGPIIAYRTRRNELTDLNNDGKQY
ncbi:MAG: aromatic ring-hydroxylating dioxygenase subunit alpha [Anaerolineales bacterium]|nr:aromatic ring-hydroxylating dioxygenase subunit alpha [Anaerolineales bacterium]